MSEHTVKKSVERTVVHAVFHLQRTYAAPPRRVFRAFSDPQAKAMWFGGPPGRWQPLERTMDFKVGGRERAKVKWNNGPTTTFDALYHDIIEDQRILYTYTMFIDERKISVSLATIEISPGAGGGTQFKLCEQGAFLDGFDDNGSRERGTSELMDLLGTTLLQPIPSSGSSP